MESEQTKHNFICTNSECVGSQAYESRYSVKVVGDDTIYLVKNKEINCKECGKSMTNVSSFSGFATTYGAFQSMTPDQRAAVLDKRSHEHYLKEIREKKIAMNREAVTKFNNL